MAYICDVYSHHTLISEEYNEDTMIIQINLSYELGKNKKPISTYKIKNKEGFEQGIEKGIKQGSNKEKIKIARNLLTKNIDIKIISETTGLSIEDVKKISCD